MIVYIQRMMRLYNHLLSECQFDIPVMEKSGDKKKVATKGKRKNNTYR